VATGYEVFYTSSPTTPFGSTPVQKVPLRATSTLIPNAQSGYYALSAVTPSGGLVMYNELAGTEGTGQQQAPSFGADSPPTTATVGQPYTYTFIATGSPDMMTYTLKGAPAWLTINASSGAVSGKAPAGAGDFSYAVTTSTVTPATTNTALKLTKKVIFGSKTAADFTATATATGVILPGSVTVFAGTTALCTADLSGGVAACTLTATQLPIGVHTVKAVYTSPAGDITGSTSAAASLTVEPVKSTTTLTYTTPVTSGAEQAAAFKAKVTAPGTTPTGSVAIKQGDDILCTAMLSAGIGTCTLTAAQLKAGTYSIKAVYTPGNANIAGSTSSAYSLVVRA
jgi:hypothetical protein